MGAPPAFSNGGIFREESMPANPCGRVRSVLTGLVLTLLPSSGAAQQAASETAGGAPFEVVEASIEQLQQAMSSGRVSAVQLVDAYLARIAAYDQQGPRLNAMVRLNPRARAEAEALDRERRERGPRGPLHGVPIVLKDNYDLAGMPTTAGSLAMAGLLPPDDGFQVRKLREAGAVVLGKTNMHELASGILTVGSLLGQTRNPYDPTRNPGGSSGGTGAAVAASYAAVGWGSDTCGSIRIPAAHNNLFGLRPTKGLSSIDGILPLSHTQDVGGPLARSVMDLALALDATVGFDPTDPATAILQGGPLPRFVAALDTAALSGARIGVLDQYFGTDADDRAAGNVVRSALEQMERAGAQLVPLVIVGLDSLSQGAAVIDHEFKWDLADYLSGIPGAPIDSLGDVLELGLVHEALVATTTRRNASPARDSEAYRVALSRRGPLRDAVVAALDAERLDAIAYPTVRRPPSRIGEAQAGSTCSLSANTGLPALTIPAGFTGGLPIGLELLGRPLSDTRLVSLAYAYERRTQPRQAPRTTPALVDGRAPAPVRFTVVASGAQMDPRAAGSTQAAATFVFDRISATLSYQVTVSGARAADVFAVAVRRRVVSGSGAVSWQVVEVLSGPELLSSSGSWALTPAMVTRLEQGELYLDVFTRDHPAGAARARIDLPSPR
jgi:Asp-tRNA(Asn)/Glu-tRNA(Gln) amidotransferase A subunit family amidase